MLSKFVVWIKNLWISNKDSIVKKLIEALDSTKDDAKKSAIETIKNSYSEQDLSKMTVEEVVGISVNIAYSKIEEIIKRQI